ncbi:PKD domain-containing protein [Elongatibacter sediminis]|uniref:PKD domain-containing protein n=1 Tax=Elongatibacter sediminis TaxID=3119006 RepID=A0AAW9R5G1_9GAMM
MISADGNPHADWEIHHPGASFIKIHFATFRLPRGWSVEVSNPLGTEVYRYSESRKSDYTADPREGDDGRSRFSAMSISGDSAIVRVVATKPNPAAGKSKAPSALKQRVSIDYYMVGLPGNDIETGGVSSLDAFSSLEASGSKNKPVPESTCGVYDRQHVACYENSHPAEFDHSWPVAKIIVSGSIACTAWRVGAGNRLFTNHHCIENQDLLSATEVWFDYQRLRCQYSEVSTPVKVSGGTLLATSSALDYTLFTVANFDSIEPFGYLGLDISQASRGDRIYIPQHGGGNPKQLAIESDMNLGGLCEIDSENEDGNTSGTDYGYYCDTWGGSSGSPVLLADNHRVTALHHHGGCFNSGVKMSLIWPEVSTHFDGIVPGGDDGGDGGGGDTPPTAAFDASCEYLQCAFDATESSDADGSIVSYQWNWGDGSSASGISPAHAFAGAGTYQVVLTVLDNDGLSAQETQFITVAEGNADPVAAFSVTCDGLSCSFDAGASSDPDGTIALYEWSFGDGSGSSDTFAVQSHDYATGGDYPVMLTVTDDDGAQSSASTSLSVTPPNQPPIADFEFSCTGLDCSFDGSPSQDPDGVITEYAWDFGDGSPVVHGVQRTHVFSDAGIYEVTLTIADDAEASQFVNRAVEVSAVEQNPISLQVSGDKYRGTKSATLTWGGALSGFVEIWRDGALLITTENDGEYVDNDVHNKTKSASYRVCETGSVNCSDSVDVTF